MSINKSNEVRILYARLLKMGIGEFLISREFNYFCIEKNLHKFWEYCEATIRSQSSSIVLIPGYTADAEEALEIFLNEIFKQEGEIKFQLFLNEFLKCFINWRVEAIDFSLIQQNLQNFGFNNTKISQLIKINENKKKIQKNTGGIVSKLLRPGTDNKSAVNRKVFIVHGHDHAIRDAVARFLTKIELEPIILDEKPSGGKSIIEKIEAYDDVDFAIVLLTPDDLGKAKSDTELKTRARQNVILELGYFMGLLGRENVCALHAGIQELPSDYSGVIYIPYDKEGGWHLKITKELKNVNFEINMDKLID